MCPRALVKKRCSSDFLERLQRTLNQLFRVVELAGGTAKKVIVVPGRLINVVI